MSEPIELLAPYLAYLENYLPALTLAGLITFFLLDRLPTEWYANQKPNVQFWIAFGLGAILSVAVLLLSRDIIPDVTLPTSIGGWAFLVIVGGLSPKVFYHLADLGDGVVAFFDRYK